MIIRPVSDLRNKYNEVEQDVLKKGPVFLTKNGYGSMVVMSIKQFEQVSDAIEYSFVSLDSPDSASTEITPGKPLASYSTVRSELNPSLSDLSKTEFDTRMARGLADAKANKGLPADIAFSQLLSELSQKEVAVG